MEDIVDLSHNVFDYSLDIYETPREITLCEDLILASQLNEGSKKFPIELDYDDSENSDEYSSPKTDIKQDECVQLVCYDEMKIPLNMEGSGPPSFSKNLNEPASSKSHQSNKESNSYSLNFENSSRLHSINLLLNEPRHCRNSFSKIGLSIAPKKTPLKRMRYNFAKPIPKTFQYKKIKTENLFEEDNVTILERLADVKFDSQNESQDNILDLVAMLPDEQIELFHTINKFNFPANIIKKYNSRKLFHYGYYINNQKFVQYIADKQYIELTFYLNDKMVLDDNKECLFKFWQESFRNLLVVSIETFINQLQKTTNCSSKIAKSISECIANRGQYIPIHKYISFFTIFTTQSTFSDIFNSMVKNIIDTKTEELCELFLRDISANVFYKYYFSKKTAHTIIGIDLELSKLILFCEINSRRMALIIYPGENHFYTSIGQKKYFGKTIDDLLLKMNLK